MDDKLTTPSNESPCHTSNETVCSSSIDAGQTENVSSTANGNTSTTKSETTLSSALHERADLHQEKKSKEREKYRNFHSRPSRVSIRTLPLNDQALYDASDHHLSPCYVESKPPSPPMISSPLFIDDSAFAKRESYHQAVFKSSKMTLPISSDTKIIDRPSQQNENKCVVKSEFSCEQKLSRHELTEVKESEEKQETDKQCTLQNQTSASDVDIKNDCISNYSNPSPDTTFVSDPAESESNYDENEDSKDNESAIVEDVRNDDTDNVVHALTKVSLSPEYPEELNPFSEEDEEESISVSEQKTEKTLKVEYNPFDDEPEENSETNSLIKKSEETNGNPFLSDSDEEEELEKEKSKLSNRILENGSCSKTPVPLPRSKVQTTIQLSEPSPRHSIDYSALSSKYAAGSNESNSQSIFRSPQSTPHRKKKPPPPPPVPNQICSKEQKSSPLMFKEGISPTPETSARTTPEKNTPEKLSRPNSIYCETSSAGNTWKRKKGPAPARPTPLRRAVKEMPFDDIQTEIGDIEVREQELERQSQQLEQIIREKTETESAESRIVQEMVLQLFELVNKKNELFRRRSELINMRKMYQLEKEHADLEYQVRCLMLKPASNKTDCDKIEEEGLIKKLLEVVERRNEIIEAMEKDRQREVVEDHSVNVQLGQNGVSYAKSPKKKGEEKKSKKSPNKLNKAERGGDNQEKHSPSQLIKQKLMTLSRHRSTSKKLPHSPT